MGDRVSRHPLNQSNRCVSIQTRDVRTGHGRDLADLLGLERVDDGGLAHVGVAHHAHADLLLVLCEWCLVGRDGGGGGRG